MIPAAVRPDPYDHFAPLYDEVMKDFPYAQWLAYIDRLCAHFSCPAKRVLDVACGTGTFALMLSRRGTRVAGVDRSAAMVREARAKAEREGFNIPFLVQEMSNLALGERFDLVVCMYDSINYLVEPEAMARVLARVARVLSARGLFIFDMNTAYGLEQFWGNRTEEQEVGSTTILWEYTYERRTRLAGLSLEFRNGGGAVTREEHLERAYGRVEMEALLAGAGLEAVAVTEDRKLEPPGKFCDRAWFVARRGQEA